MGDKPYFSNWKKDNGPLRGQLSVRANSVILRKLDDFIAKAKRANPNSTITKTQVVEKALKEYLGDK